MPIEWYFKKDGLEQGPVGSDDLRMLVSFGMLRPDDLVRKAEMTNWAPASALKGLFREPASRPVLNSKSTATIARNRPAAPSIRASTSKNAAVAAPERRTAMAPGTTLGTATGATPGTTPKATPEPNAGSTARPAPARIAQPRQTSKWLAYMTATAALFVAAGALYRYVIQPRDNQMAAAEHSPAPPQWQPATEPVLASAITDPLLLAISSDSPFDRGMAFRQVRSATVSPKIRAQVHQIICDTLDNRAFSTIWSSAAQALGEVGTSADLPKLKPLIEQAPLETQCAAMATAMVLDPVAGMKYFEPHAGDDTYGSTTEQYLAGWGARSEPVALAMLQSPQRMCRNHALFLLKAFGTPKALDAIAKAKEAESNKLIADGYQLTIDAITSRNQ